MKKLMLTGLVCAGMLALATSASAHGGQYRGPGDVVPPGGSGGGGRTPGPKGPVTPGPSGPSTPGPAGPSTPGPAGPTTGGPAAPGGTGPTTGPRGAPVGPDLSKWQFWWEWNKDPFIKLKDAIHSNKPKSGSDEFFMGGTKRAEGKDTMKPTEAEILNTILPALKRSLDSTDDRDITSSCLVAIAKIGKNHDNFEILPLMKERLNSPQQEIRETAALSMGISQMTDAVPDLVELVNDTEKGRKLSNRSQVDYRVRTFAMYGLGLVAYATNNADVKRKVYEAAKKVIEDYKNIVDRNIKVAAVNAIRLVRPEAEGGEKHKKLLDDCIATLSKYWGDIDKAGQGEQQIMAHVPPAIAQLLGRSGDPDSKFKDAFAKELSGRGKKRNVTIYQSCAVALGLMAQAQEVEKKDAKYSKSLLDHFNKGRDLQAKYFSLMAMAKIGGDHNRNELLKIVAKGNKATERPWAGISLGVLAFRKLEADKDRAEVDETVGTALLKQFRDIKNPEARAAMAIGLGLTKYAVAADELQDNLLRYKNQDELAGYLCIGLALMNADRAVEDIRNIVKASVRRPDLLKQAAIGLGKLGDKEVANDLQEMLKDDSKNVAKLSAIASALGFIGDRRSVDPLKKLLFDESVTELSRAFAAVALGGVADKEPLPWNSKIAVDVNYRAAVETLTDGVAGILDIL